MKAEHFIYGYFPKNGVKLIKSPGITDKLLSKDELTYLCHVADKLAEPAMLWWTNGHVFTFTSTHPTQDEYKRKTVWNHTIILPFADYIRITEPFGFLSSHFIDKPDKVAGTQIQPLEI